MLFAFSLDGLPLNRGKRLQRRDTTGRCKNRASLGRWTHGSATHELKAAVGTYTL
jgi:hypothetical protein